MKIFSLFRRALLAFVYAVIIAVSADLIYSFFTDPFYLKQFLLIFLVSFVVLFFCGPLRRNFWIAVLAEAVLGLGIVCTMYAFYRSAPYQVTDNGKAELYGDKNIMILVPHQDDEVLVASGIVESYVEYGSEVSIAFLTNAEYGGDGLYRLSEALQVAELLQVPEKNVFFLGYADQGKLNGIHAYNLPDDTLTYSSKGLSETYALDTHPAFNPGNAYTKGNMRADIKALLLQQQPEIIYCVSVEPHPDHSALALLLDEAMAEILCEAPDYQPIVLMSSCYATGLYSVKDFYSPNLLSTKDPTGGDYFTNAFDWQQRIRFPVDASKLSRSIYGCGTYQQLKLHTTQSVRYGADSVVNSDKVFWLRDSSSICYNAQISTSSGSPETLNDFKIFDNANVYGDFAALGHNTWIPDESDLEKTVFVELESPSYIQRICLYDDPGMKNNVLNALITFDDGSSLETGPLSKNGVSSYEINKDDVKSFSVKLLETEGDNAGLTEIEAYNSQRDYGFDFIKLQNLQGDFVYDYYIDKSGQEEFSVFSSGVAGDFTVSSDNTKCSIIYEEGLLSVDCPSGEECTITVSSEDGLFTDTVRISNPGRFMREYGPWLENRMRLYSRNNFPLCITYQLFSEPENLIAILRQSL